MVGSTRVPVLVTGLVVLALTASASAQQDLFGITFDGQPDPNYTYAYDYAGGGNPQMDHSALSSAASTVTGGGRGGGNAFSLSGDFTAVPTMPDYNYKGLGGGIGVFRYDFGTNTALGLPSGNLADYTLSVDLSAAGFTEPPASSVRIALQLQVKDDRFTPDADTNFDPFAVINFTAPVSAQYSTATFRLDQGTLTFDQNRVPAGNRDFSAHATDIGLINPDFAAELNWGTDADNRVFIDNVRLLVVPEPASALLLAAGLAFAATRRPRRSR